jgi:hypothetical protein
MKRRGRDAGTYSEGTSKEPQTNIKDTTFYFLILYFDQANGDNM